jgi:hypothetical protein
VIWSRTTSPPVLRLVHGRGDEGGKCQQEPPRGQRDGRIRRRACFLATHDGNVGADESWVLVRETLDDDEEEEEESDDDEDRLPNRQTPTKQWKRRRRRQIQEEEDEPGESVNL